MKIVCLCGSTKFKEEFITVAADEEKKGNVVLTVGFYTHADNIKIDNDMKARLDLLHIQKIDMCDEVFIINKDGYIGSSTKNELAYAQARNKGVRFYTNEYEINGGSE